MRMRGGSFGLILLLVVMGIVLMLVAKNWHAVAPTALDLRNASDRPAAGATGSEQFPDLQQMRKSTSVHRTAVTEGAGDTE